MSLEKKLKLLINTKYQEILSSNPDLLDSVFCNNNTYLKT